MNASLTSPCAARAVAEVGETARRARGRRCRRAVALHAHRVAGGVQGLGADHDRVEVEVELGRVPVAVVDAAEQAEQLQRVEAATPGDAVLAVGREDEVLGPQGPAGADLRGLLAEQLRPDAELTVPLQGGRLDVDPPDEHHVAVEAAELLGGEVHVELGVVDPLALGRQQLDQLGAAVFVLRPEDLDEVGPEASVLMSHSTPSCRRKRGVSAVRWPAGNPRPSTDRGGGAAM